MDRVRRAEPGVAGPPRAEAGPEGGGGAGGAGPAGGGRGVGGGGGGVPGGERGGGPAGRAVARDAADAVRRGSVLRRRRAAAGDGPGIHRTDAGAVPGEAAGSRGGGAVMTGGVEALTMHLAAGAAGEPTRAAMRRAFRIPLAARAAAVAGAVRTFVARLVFDSLAA